MAIKIPNAPNFFKVGTSTERNTLWHDGSLVYVEDIDSFFILDSGSWVPIGTNSGVLTIKETTTPTDVEDYGKVYCKDDNKLYFQDGGGTEHEVSSVP